MTTMATKSSLIEEIVKVTGVTPEKYFDSLLERNTKYLSKLLRVVKLLSK